MQNIKYLYNYLKMNLYMLNNIWYFLSFSNSFLPSQYKAYNSKLVQYNSLNPFPSKLYIQIYNLSKIHLYIINKQSTTFIWSSIIFLAEMQVWSALLYRLQHKFNKSNAAEILQKYSQHTYLWLIFFKPSPIVLLRPLKNSCNTIYKLWEVP